MPIVCYNSSMSNNKFPAQADLFISNMSSAQLSGLASQDDQLLIRVSSSEEQTFTADRPSLAAISTCVRGLPADAAVWDLSNFIIDGQPVPAIVVRDWLDAVYVSLHDEPCDAPYPYNLASSMSCLNLVLAFADAVGSSRGVFKAVLERHLPDLSFSVTLGEDRHSAFAACEPYLWHGVWQLALYRTAEPNYPVTGVASVAERLGFMQQITKQLEAVLFLAYKLRLPQLLSTLQEVIRYNCMTPLSLLFGHLGAVLSPRVRDAAAAAPGMDSVSMPGAGSSTTAQQGYVNSILTQPCTFVSPLDDDQLDYIFTPIRQQEYSTPEPTEFAAALARDFMHWKAGEVVTLKLDLFGSVPSPYGSVSPGLHIRTQGAEHWVTVPVQLLLGNLVDSPLGLYQVMGDGPKTLSALTDDTVT